jgi:GNAT superfamily N-acetyltransferase
VKNKLPTVDEFICLRKAVEWRIPDPGAVKRSLYNTLFGVCLEKDNQCIGCGRVIGDGSLVFHVQDIIVLPDYQRKGYGSLIMDAIMEYIHETAMPTAFIALFASPFATSWYSRYGFIERPYNQFGPGMAFFINHSPNNEIHAPAYSGV